MALHNLVSHDWYKVSNCCKLYSVTSESDTLSSMSQEGGKGSLDTPLALATVLISWFKFYFMLI